MNNTSGGRGHAMVMTFGCQQNEADSDRIRGILKNEGYLPTDDREQADVIIINTCAVREHAESKVLGVIGALKGLKAARPGLIIGVAGCMSQQPHRAQQLRKTYRQVDIIMGTQAMHLLPSALETVRAGRGPVVLTGQDDIITEGLPVLREGAVTAHVSVMYGCNNFCSYCIVPYVRGRERSRDALEVEREVRGLVEGGYRDIMLLGQNVNSYAGCEGGFPALLRRLSEIPGDFVLRFMTSHPKDATPALVAAMADCPKVERHIHLPFQAGDDEVLRRMNRGYTAEQYLALAAQFKRAMPDIAITSDVIVGFPGESEAAFEGTLRLVRELEAASMFTFIYSDREGTPASGMDGKIPYDVKLDRLNRLCELQNAISLRLGERLVGRSLRVLCEGLSRDDPAHMCGRTSDNRLVNFSGDARPGEFCTVEITEARTFSLLGRIRG